MKRGRLLYLAQLLREHQAELDEALTEVVTRRAPLTESEARVILESAAARIQTVEGALIHDATYEPRFGLVYARRAGGRTLARLRSWTRPRIGRLRHYEPRPLRVPVRYVRTRPPQSAPTISIVTPAYQQGRFLGRTIHSVVSQDYPALEYVVRDGGSSDGTVEVLQRFDRLIAFWKSEPDAGQADAINRGFRDTTGEIMAWLNSDDLLLPGTLAYVARYFARHPAVDVVYGNRLMIDEHDGQIGAWILPRHDDRALTLADYIPQETLFWRRNVWEAAGGRVDPTFNYALDWELLLRFREVGARMVHLPRYLGAFRVHDEQKTTATDGVGRVECARLRERVHGRDVPIAEVLDGLRPYFARHILVHTRYRLLDRMPLPRVAVILAQDER